MVKYMIPSTELTKDQKEFAAENHHVVENFLKYRNLSRDEYYDVVIFGYLRAVKKYFMRSDLWVYNFSTIAQYAMKTDLYNHYRKQRRQKRTAVVISLDDTAYDNGSMTLAETTAARGMVSDRLDAEALWNEITANFSDEYVEVLRMKTEGYSDREIARNRGVQLKDVTNIIAKIRQKVADMRINAAVR